MKNWTIRQKIVGSFAILLLLTLVMGGATLMRFESIDRVLANIDQDILPILHETSQLDAVWLDNLLLTQKSVQQKDQSEMRKLAAQLQANQASFDNLVAKFEAQIVDEDDRQFIKGVKNDRAAYVRIQLEVLKLVAAFKTNEAQAMLVRDLVPAFQKVQGSFRALIDTHFGEIDKSQRQLISDTAETRLSILAALVIIAALAFSCGFFLFRAVTKSGVQVTTSATEVATTAKQQQATAGEIAATTSEIGATSKEIWATSKELVKTMNEVSSVAEQSAALASNGQAGLTQMEETMGRVVEAAGSINSKLSVLNERASNISQVVTTITKVADQTNLLSLNAAIEAEKAGEQGRGFSVVAVEIRRLADQTAVATYDIEQMVKDIQSAVSAGVMGMDKFSEEVRRGMQEVQHVGSQLLEIIQQVQTLAPRIEAVNEGMQAQAAGAEQISEALAQLSEAARQSVESLRQSGMAIEGLNQVANTLFGSITGFKLQT